MLKCAAHYAFSLNSNTTAKALASGLPKNYRVIAIQEYDFAVCLAALRPRSALTID